MDQHISEGIVVGILCLCNIRVPWFCWSLSKVNNFMHPIDLFCLSAGTPLGHTILKHRHIAASGWKVVSLSYQEVGLCLSFWRYSIFVYTYFHIQDLKNLLKFWNMEWLANFKRKCGGCLTIQINQYFSLLVSWVQTFSYLHLTFKQFLITCNQCQLFLWCKRWWHGILFFFPSVLVGGTCGIEVAIARGVRVARALRNWE